MDDERETAISVGRLQGWVLLLVVGGLSWETVVSYSELDEYRECSGLEWMNTKNLVSYSG